MPLNYDEVECYLHKIFSGVDYKYIDDVFLEFRFPPNKISQQASLIFERSKESAIKQGMLSKDDLEILINKRNLITTEEITKLKKLYNQLEAQEILLGKTTLVKANQDRIKKIINRLKHDINEIEFKKMSKLLMSADTKAEEDKSFYLCSRCTYKEDGDLLWTVYNDAKLEKNIRFKDKVLTAFLQVYSGISTTVIRELARCTMWRIRYVNSIKTSESLFGVSTSDYTTDQLNLVYWSNYYQNIFDMMPEDRPSEMIIDDDDTLDAYMQTFYQDRNKQDSARKHNSKRSGKISAFDSEEVIITSSHELYQDIAYDKPDKAEKLKDRIDIRKRTRRG